MPRQSRSDVGGCAELTECEHGLRVRAHPAHRGPRRRARRVRGRPRRRPARRRGHARRARRASAARPCSPTSCRRRRSSRRPRPPNAIKRGRRPRRAVLRARRRAASRQARGRRSTSPRSTSACSRSPRQQSEDMRARSSRRACASSQGDGRLDGPQRRRRLDRPRSGTDFDRDRGRHPRRLGRRAARACCRRAKPDGERILTWTQLYELDAGARAPDRRRLRRHRRRVRVGLPERSAPKVTLVSSRDQVLPGEDADAAAVHREGLQAQRHDGARRSRRAESVERDGDGVRRHPRRRPHRRGQPLPDGRRLDPEHRRASASRRPACS